MFCIVDQGLMHLLRICTPWKGYTAIQVTTVTLVISLSYCEIIGGLHLWIWWVPSTPRLLCQARVIWTRMVVGFQEYILLYALVRPLILSQWVERDQGHRYCSRTVSDNHWINLWLIVRSAPILLMLDWNPVGLGAISKGMGREAWERFGEGTFVGCAFIPLSLLLPSAVNQNEFLELFSHIPAHLFASYSILEICCTKCFWR